MSAACHKCGATLPVDAWGLPRDEPCPSCGHAAHLPMEDPPGEPCHILGEMMERSEEAQSMGIWIELPKQRWRDHFRPLSYALKSLKAIMINETPSDEQDCWHEMAKSACLRGADSRELESSGLRSAVAKELVNGLGSYEKALERADAILAVVRKVLEGD